MSTRLVGGLWSRTAAVAAFLSTLLTLSLLAPSPGAGVTTPVVDGTSVERAAASCWEIKRNDPSSPSGSYWLWTPDLMAPQQFHCDMERRGGGWVLIGRGREDWRTTYNGFGTPDDLLGPRTDFTTAQLPARTIDGLLGGRPVRTLKEGIRVRRAMDAGGTRWQEVTFSLRDRGRWVWTFGAGHRIGTFVFKNDGRTRKGKGGQSRRFGVGDKYRTVVTSAPANQRYTQGFSYGPKVTASPDPDSFLWASTAGQGFARPYAEVYIRPRLESADFADVPAAGTPAITRRAMVSTWAAPTRWGVTGLATKRREEGHVEVQALAEGQGRIYVGGNFTTVQRGKDATGADVVEQPYLAAFDMVTGDYVPTFQPALDAEVKALAVLPDGRLAIGGAFTDAGGMDVTGVAVLDGVTGAPDETFQLALGAPRGAAREVRDLEVVGSELYVSGAFASARGAQGPGIEVDNAVRVSWVSGMPDAGWTPAFNGFVNDSTPSEDGARMYFAGHFTATGGTPTRRVAEISTADGAALLSAAWSPRWSAELDYQRAIAVGEDRIWVGGSQHSLFSFDVDGYARRSSSISARGGGDFQAVSLAPGVVYAGCHCNLFNYQGADTYGARVKGWKQADKINWVGAWTSAGRYLPEFSPLMRSSEGAGVWATLVDSTGALWAGGDLRSVQTGPTTAQWLGSFARFPVQDHQAPTTPTGFSAVAGGDGQVTLSWTPSTDDSSSELTYEVLRNDRVVAVTSASTVEVTGDPGDRFFVRAADPTGNRSASTAAVTAS